MNSLTSYNIVTGNNAFNKKGHWSPKEQAFFLLYGLLPPTRTRTQLRTFCQKKCIRDARFQKALDAFRQHYPPKDEMGKRFWHTAIVMKYEEFREVCKAAWKKKTNDVNAVLDCVLYYEHSLARKEQLAVQGLLKMSNPSATHAFHTSSKLVQLELANEYS